MISMSVLLLVLREILALFSYYLKIFFHLMVDNDHLAVINPSRIVWRGNSLYLVSLW